MAAVVKRLGRVSQASPFANTLFTVGAGKTNILAELRLTNTTSDLSHSRNNVAGAYTDQDSAVKFNFDTTNHQADVVVHTDGTMYVADAGNHRIRKITPQGIVSTLAGSGSAAETDGTGEAAAFNRPVGLALSSDGTTLYVCTLSGNKIRVVNTSTGAVTTLAGSGTAADVDDTGTAAQFNNPKKLIIDNTDANLYVTTNGRIRKIVISSGVVTTVAGSTIGTDADGTGAAATLNSPQGLCFSPDQSVIYFATNAMIRQVVVATGVVTSLAGNATTQEHTDGVGTAARFSGSQCDLAIDPAGLYLYRSERAYNVIRRMHLASLTVETFCGDRTAANTEGIGTLASINAPKNITMSPDGTALVICTTHGIYRLDPFTAHFSHLAGDDVGGYANGSAVYGGPIKVSLFAKDAAGAYVTIGETEMMPHDVAVATTERIPLKSAFPANTVVKVVPSRYGLNAVASGVEV